MTQEQMDFLRNYLPDIPVENETPKERSDRKVRLFYQRLNFANKNLHSYLSEDNRSKVRSVSLNFCRRGNGSLTFTYTVFMNTLGSPYRMLFQNLSQVDLVEMALFLDRETPAIIN